MPLRPLGRWSERLYCTAPALRSEAGPGSSWMDSGPDLRSAQDACPACGTDNRQEAEFCSERGTALAGVPLRAGQEIRKIGQPGRISRDMRPGS